MSDASCRRPFHAGELRAQALAGASASGGAIRDFMPEQHREFFAMLYFLLLATIDRDGAPVATVLTGSEGFVTSPESRSLHIVAAPDANDPVRPLLQPGSPVGLLGIDFGSRRRNRVNGIVGEVDGSGFRIAVKESFGNCPKYIRVREMRAAPANPVGAPVEAFDGLDQAARDAVSTADTFFVASSAGSGRGADISHRGGEPGFIAVDGNTLTIPDFSGNRYFNTFGNLLLDPRAALLFIDFSTGDLLQLQGRVEIAWNVDAHPDAPAVERHWRFHAQRGWRRRAAVPLRWDVPNMP